jgi:hypothetical protein
MTYLEAVNEVLGRLRENSVTSVTQTSYSTLIGKFINDTKHRVEDSFQWNAQGQLITVTTSAGVSNYIITGSGTKFKELDVMNTTNRYRMINAPTAYITEQYYLAQPQNAQPVYYAYSGVDSASGDTKVDLYPIPNGTYTLIFSLIVPQAKLVSDSTVITAPTDPIILGAYALALAERGEDQGLVSSEASNLFRSSLANAIAIESGRYCENDAWSAV